MSSRSAAAVVTHAIKSCIILKPILFAAVESIWEIWWLWDSGKLLRQWHIILRPKLLQQWHIIIKPDFLQNLCSSIDIFWRKWQPEFSKRRTVRNWGSLRSVFAWLKSLSLSLASSRGRILLYQQQRSSTNTKFFLIEWLSFLTVVKD